MSYTCKIRAIVGCGLQIPIALPATNILTDGFTANWSTVPDAVYYQIYYTSDPTFSTKMVANSANGASSIVITGLDPNTIYYYMIRAEAGSLSSGLSNIITVITASISYNDYGALYNWFVTQVNGGTGVGSVAPTGWHVPSDAEYQTLATYLGGSEVAGNKLREVGTNHWATPNTGATNSSGFTAFGSGYRRDIADWADIVFADLGIDTYYWEVDFWGIVEIVNSDPIFQLSLNSVPGLGYSIRCVKNSTTLTNGQTSTVTDYDGKVYPTICIGTQEWMARNLDVTHYNDGTPIQTTTDNAIWAGWSESETPGMCWYNNIPV